MKKTTEKPITYKYRLSDRRYERPDPRPMAIPVGFERPESLQEKLKRLVGDAQIQKELEDAGLETFAEADDFDTGEDLDVARTPYEEDFDPGFNAARIQETRAQVVQEPSEEELAKAKEVLNRYKTSRRAGDKKRRSADKEASK